MFYLLVGACLIGLIGAELFQRIIEKFGFSAGNLYSVWYTIYIRNFNERELR